VVSEHGSPLGMDGHSVGHASMSLSYMFFMLVVYVLVVYTWWWS